MKRHILLVLCAVLLGGTVAAKDALAILPFTGGDGEDGETIAELFSYDAELNAVFNPIPRTSIAKAIQNERNFQLSSGMTDPDTIAAIGVQLGARYVVAGNIATLGSNKLLVISIVKVDDLQQVAGDLQTYNRIEEIQGKLPNMARNIIASIKIDRARLPKLAIVPFQLRNTTNESDADVLAQILSMYIVRSGKYAVYPRTSSLEQVQDEYSAQSSGDVADENRVDIGKGVNPKYVLSGAARKLGTTTNMFNASIINLETGVQEVGKSVNYKNLDDGINVMQELAYGLAGGTEQIPLVIPVPSGTQTATTAQKAPKPAKEPKPPKEPKTETEISGAGERVRAGFLNIALGIGSFTMGDWGGGLTLVGGYAAAAGLIAWELAGLSYDDAMAGIPGTIGLIAGIGTVSYGFIRPFIYNKKPALASALDNIQVTVLPDSSGIKRMGFVYTHHF